MPGLFAGSRHRLKTETPVYMLWGTEERNRDIDVSLWDLSRVHVARALG